MKLSLLQQNHNTRRTNSFRPSSSPADGVAASDGIYKSPANIFWLLLYGLCCLISLVLGFRFSRVFFFLLFATTTIYTSDPILHSTTTTTTTTTTMTTTTTTLTETLTLPLINSPPNRTRSRVVVGRHGIRIRPWPHPNPIETKQAHQIIERVQREQRVQYGVKNPRPLIVVTPTYVRTFQTLHLTGLMHSLMLVPYRLTWIVVEAGGVSNETASLLARSNLSILHVPFFGKQMPLEWPERHLMEARMRLHALRVVREQRMDGIVVFADDSNIHSMELFDEIQKVKWMGTLSIGILTHSGNSSPLLQRQLSEEEKENLPVPVQGPACNSSAQLVGWHTFNSLPYGEKSATYVGEGAKVLPAKLEWAGFVLNSRLLWKDAEGKPGWVRDLDDVGENGEEIKSPLGLLKDASFVEPLGNCGKKVLLWWLRAEARSDSKFPPGWIIDPPLEVIVPAKHTPWPDAPPQPPLEKMMTTNKENVENRFSGAADRSSRSMHSSHIKRNHDSQMQEK